jgi:hypothetical protein
VVGAGRGHCWHRGSCRTGRPRCTGDHDRAHEQLDDRLRSWPVTNGDDQVTMTRGFHAFFRQYSNLRALLRRVDPDLQSLLPGRVAIEWLHYGPVLAEDRLIKNDCPRWASTPASSGSNADAASRNHARPRRHSLRLSGRVDGTRGNGRLLAANELSPSLVLLAMILDRSYALSHRPAPRLR